jgi:hypothetical protein
VDSPFTARPNTLGLSARATRQLERMIDDGAWLMYPLHLAAGIFETFVYGFLFIVAIFLYLGIWMTAAHDRRAEEIKNPASEQTIYRVDTAKNSVTVAKAGYAVDKEDFDQAFDGCEGTGGQLKNPTFWDHNWLAEKSDMFQSSCSTAKHAVQLARDVGHKETPAEEFAREFEVAVICGLLFIGFIGIWIAPRIHTFTHSSEN